MFTCKGKSNFFCISNSKHDYHLPEIAQGDKKISKIDISSVPWLNSSREIGD